MRLLTAKEVSRVLQVKPARVYELARARVIPAVRVGERQVRFDEGALREWVRRGGRAQSSQEAAEVAQEGAIAA